MKFRVTKNSTSQWDVDADDADAAKAAIENVKPSATNETTQVRQVTGGSTPVIAPRASVTAPRR